jgi:hypothetical protein
MPLERKAPAVTQQEVTMSRTILYSGLAALMLLAAPLAGSAHAGEPLETGGVPLSYGYPGGTGTASNLAAGRGNVAQQRYLGSGGLSGGCNLASTRVTLATNLAIGQRNAAQQQVSGAPVDPRCHPLVSTSVAVPLNLGVGNRNTAQQQVTGVGGPTGSLVNNGVATPLNMGIGSGNTAQQQFSFGR